VLSIRKMTLGSGYRYLMESVATGDGARHQSTSLADYYAASGTPPGVFLGAGLAGLGGGRGVEVGSEVSEQHLFNLLGMGADPITGEALGRPPMRSRPSLRGRDAERIGAGGEASTADQTELVAGKVDEEPVNSRVKRAPVAGFDLTFSPSKSISTAWALADADTRATISACHRRAIEVVLTYAEREVFHSRSGKNGVVQEEIEGVVATAFTHFDSRAGDPQLHDHVVVANRARSVSDGEWRTLDSRGLFKGVVMLGELHQGILADLLTRELGWDWDERSRRHSDQVRWEVTGISETLLAEFSQRAAAIEERKEVLIPAFVAAQGRQPTTTEIIQLRQRATLETRPLKEHRPLAVLTAGWRQRAERHVGSDPQAWVVRLSGRNDLPLLRAGDLADEILADAARVTIRKVAERRATFSRANVLAEVHRQFHGVRFASADDRIAVAERTADLAVGQSLLASVPELHFTPEGLRRTDGSSRFRAKGTRSTPLPPSSTPRPVCSMPGERWMAPPSLPTRGRPPRQPRCPGGTTHFPSIRPSQWSRSRPPGAGSTCWSARRAPASRPQWLDFGLPGKPNMGRARCSAWPLRQRPQMYWPKPWAPRRRTPRSGSTSTAS
jgi:conjugative relaxase-like TrwC/TraI family protein